MMPRPRVIAADRRSFFMIISKRIVSHDDYQDVYCTVHSRYAFEHVHQQRVCQTIIANWAFAPPTCAKRITCIKGPHRMRSIFFLLFSCWRAATEHRGSENAIVCMNEWARLRTLLYMNENAWESWIWRLGDLSFCVNSSSDKFATEKFQAIWMLPCNNQRWKLSAFPFQLDINSLV